VLKKESSSKIEAFLESVASASRRLLMLDYDGTLAPFRKERDQAVPYPEVVSKLEALVRSGHTRVVIISGREIHEVASLLRVTPVPELWGVYGLQHRKLDGVVEILPTDEKYVVPLSNAHRWLEYQQLMSFVEVKTGSIAVHWRGRSAAEVEEIRGRVLLGWSAVAQNSGLSLVEFDGGLEIRVPGRDKGDVVRALLDQKGSDVCAAYLGDDVTDEPAFHAIHGRGLGVLVRPEWRGTAAQAWLKPPAGVIEFLAAWLDRCQHAVKNDAKAGAANC